MSVAFLFHAPVFISSGIVLTVFVSSFRVTYIFRLLQNVGAESVFIVSGNVHAGTTKFARSFFFKFTVLHPLKCRMVHP